MTADENAKLMEKSFPFLAKEAKSAPLIQAPAPEPVEAPAPPVKKRTVGNIYTAVQAQSIYNPGQATPPDPTTGATQPGPIGNNPQNMTVKGPANAQANQGVAGAMQPQTGWGTTVG